MTSFIKSSVIAALFVAFTFFFPGSFLHAQSDAVKEARQEVIASINRLNDLENANLDPATKIAQETELKRIALQNILTLTTLETKDVSLKLNALPHSNNEKINALRSIFGASIDSYFAYLDAAKTSLAEQAGLDAIQSFAGDLKTWREAVYNTNMNRVVIFTLVLQNQETLRITDLRLEKIDAALKQAIASQLKTEPALALFLQAKANLQTAHTINDSALAQILAYLPNQPTAPLTESNATATITNGLDGALPPKIAPPDPRKLVAASVQEIASAYDKFIKISDILKKL